MKYLILMAVMIFTLFSVSHASDDKAEKTEKAEAGTVSSKRVPAQIESGMSPETEEYLKQAGRKVESVFEPIDKSQ